MSRVQIKISRIDELPASKKPWQVALYHGMWVFANGEHEPRIFRDGVFEVLQPHHVASTAGSPDE